MLTPDYRGWTSGTFTVPGGDYYFWASGGCQVRINNYMANSTLTYCWNDLRGVTDYIACNCQATQNAYGGYCLMGNAWNVGRLLIMTTGVDRLNSHP